MTARIFAREAAFLLLLPIFPFHYAIAAARRPYGGTNEGLHDFVAYQSRHFTSHFIAGKNDEEARSQMEHLVNKLATRIESIRPPMTDRLPVYALLNPEIAALLEGAKFLFSGIADRHSPEGLREVASRYKAYKPRLKETLPRTF